MNICENDINDILKNKKKLSPNNLINLSNTLNYPIGKMLHFSVPEKCLTKKMNNLIKIRFELEKYLKK